MGRKQPNYIGVIQSIYSVKWTSLYHKTTHPYKTDCPTLYNLLIIAGKQSLPRRFGQACFLDSRYYTLTSSSPTLVVSSPVNRMFSCLAERSTWTNDFWSFQENTCHELTWETCVPVWQYSEMNDFETPGVHMLRSFSKLTHFVYRHMTSQFNMHTCALAHELVVIKSNKFIHVWYIYLHFPKMIKQMYR